MILKPKPKPKLICNFCGRSADEVGRLVAGGGGKVHICDACIGVCNRVLEATPEGSADWAQRSVEELLSGLRVSEATVEATRAVLQAEIDHLRGRGVSWERIGAALGISRQAAWERFS